jgi:hypothetical protein
MGNRSEERRPREKESDWQVATGGTDPKTGMVTPDERDRISKAQTDAYGRGKVLKGRVVRKADGSTEYQEREFPLMAKKGPKR